MIVVDSSVWISHLRNIQTPQVIFLRQRADPLEIIVGDVVLLEILQGASGERQARSVSAELHRFLILPMLGEAVALNAARNYRFLRQMGFKIRKTIDLVTGTFCIEGDHQLLHQDRDFEPMRQHLGLKLASF